MTTPIFARPRTRAQARRRRRTTIVVLTVVAITAFGALAHARMSRDTCWIIPDPDGTWTAVNFDPSSFPPAGCDIAVWREVP